MALFRAAETVRPASQRLFADSFAEHFLRPGLRRALWLARRPALASFLNRYAEAQRVTGNTETRIIPFWTIRVSRFD
jgi:O-methyltransferase involved in polyketide biosynthesis